MIRQGVLNTALASLTAWGYRNPQLVYDLYSVRLLPGAAYSSHWYLQFHVRKGLDVSSRPGYVRLIVRKVAGRLFGRDHEESNAPFAGPLFTPRRA